MARHVEQDPFNAVGRPESDAVPCAEPESRRPSARSADPPPQPPIAGGAVRIVTSIERITLRIACGRLAVELLRWSLDREGSVALE